IAANVDQVLITVSVVDPPLRPTIIDRYLIAAYKGNLQPIIVCNKIDLLDSPQAEEEKALMQECKKIYEGLSIPFLDISAETKTGLDRLMQIMKDKISVFSGQSGSGKSSLINETCGYSLKVGKTVQRY